MHFHSFSFKNNLLTALNRPVTNNTLMKINTCTKLVGHPFNDNYSNLSCSWCCFTKFEEGEEGLGETHNFYYPVKPSITLVKPGFSQKNPLGWAILIKPGFLPTLQVHVNQGRLVAQWPCNYPLIRQLCTVWCFNRRRFNWLTCAHRINYCKYPTWD